MYEELLYRLQAYTKGERTKGGFSDLELYLARTKQGKGFDAAAIDQALAKLVSCEEGSHEDYAMGIALIAEKAGSHGPYFRDSLERRLFDSDSALSPRSQFEFASEFVLCGGDFGPQQLGHLTTLRMELPELWIDLALDAYPLDVAGLTEAIVNLFEEQGARLSWKALRPRYLKLVGAIGSKQFNGFTLAVSQSLSKVERSEFLDWVDKKRGSKLSTTPKPRMQVRAAAPSLPKADIDFLTDRSCLAEPVLQLEAA
ncbi:hypothetical protein [Sulfitobacter sp.]|uniref:hypothetical protein n=1 Tax=Sulfitobacter sp. TaxID=1903071 RepID=UPI0030033F8A